jgi:hypothetical protein
MRSRRVVACGTTSSPSTNEAAEARVATRRTGSATRARLAPEVTMAESSWKRAIWPSVRKVAMSRATGSIITITYGVFQAK